MPEEEVYKPPRDSNGRLLPGHKGLPGVGRKKGMSNGDKIRLMLEPERDRLVGRLLELAFDQNNPQAIRALEVALLRLAPNAKQDSERVIIPGFQDAGTLQAKAECVLQAVALGSISAEAGEKLLRIIDLYRLAISHTEVERRLAMLEGGNQRLIEHENTIEAS